MEDTGENPFSPKAKFRRSPPPASPSPSPVSNNNGNQDAFNPFKPKRGWHDHLCVLVMVRSLRRALKTVQWIITGHLTTMDQAYHQQLNMLARLVHRIIHTALIQVCLHTTIKNMFQNRHLQGL
jgi:hypothetical protein